MAMGYNADMKIASVAGAACGPPVFLGGDLRYRHNFKMQINFIRRLETK